MKFERAIPKTSVKFPTCGGFSYGNNSLFLAKGKIPQKSTEEEEAVWQVERKLTLFL